MLFIGFRAAKRQCRAKWIRLSGILAVPLLRSGHDPCILALLMKRSGLVYNGSGKPEPVQAMKGGRWHTASTHAVCRRKVHRIHAKKRQKERKTGGV